MAKKQPPPIMLGQKSILIILIVLALVLAYLLVKPFIIVLLTAGILAYIFYPAHKWLKQKLKSNQASAWILTILITIIIVIPTGFLFYQVAKEASVGYLKMEQHVNSDFESCEYGKFCNFLKNPQVKYQIQSSFEKITNYISEGANNFIFSIPKRFIELLILFFSVFFFLKDGPALFKGARDVLPIPDSHERKIVSQLSEVTRSVIYGIFVVAIIEGIVAGLAFWLAGLTSPILWAIVVTILAFIPLIGPTIIWVPAAIYALFMHEPWSALIIIIGGVVISLIDFYVKPKTIGKRAKIHPIIIFIGLLGGIALFGVVGIIVGPLILALLITFLKMYKEEK